jgi:Flp pilus assembly protein TadD
MSEVAARPARSGRLRWAALGVLSALALGGLVAFAWPSPDPEAVWQRARAAFEARDFARVEAELARLGRLREPTSLDRLLHAQLAIARGRVDPARAEALLDAGPSDHLGLALLRGRLALVQNNAPEAVRQFRIAHDKAPNLRESVLGLGQALQAVGDQAAATPILEEARKHERLGGLVQRAAVEANRSDPGLIRDLGDACAAVGRFPEARAWYYYIPAESVCHRGDDLAISASVLSLHTFKGRPVNVHLNGFAKVWLK